MSSTNRKWVVGRDGHHTQTAIINQHPFWRLATPTEVQKIQTLEDWANKVNIGCLTDADGYGFYADFAEGAYIVSDCIVVPSDMTMGTVNLEYSHVVWVDS